MYRRRRRPEREIAFSLDSFLDLVANVVGIIIRLILVAWVGARSYKTIINLPMPETAAAAPAPAKEPDDPARKELDRHRKELQDTQDRLLAQLRLQAEALKTQWQVEAVTAPLGPFRLRYVVERTRGALASALGGPPDPDGNFSYGVRGWVVEPLAVERGEAADAALLPTSAFR